MKNHPYPYEIPKIENFDPKSQGQLDPWDILEFLRVEALLRSPKVHQLYKASPPTVWTEDDEFRLSKEDALKLIWEDSLRDAYDVGNGWLTLRGFHHRLLLPRHQRPGPATAYTNQPYATCGITDLKAAMCEMEKRYHEKTGWGVPIAKKRSEPWESLQSSIQHTSIQKWIRCHTSRKITSNRPTIKE